MEVLNVYCAIIGGGASGLMCASIASKRNKDKKIVVIERENRVGKKILVSGNSRCNLTNMSANVEHYHSSFADGVIFLLQNYPPQKVLDYFYSIGLVTMVDEQDRVYPLSRQASAVLSVLRNELRRNNVTEICDTQITSITKHDNGYKLKSDNMTIYAQKVVIATGGKNNYAQKVVCDTYAPARRLGHKIGALYPSLSPVRVNSRIIKSLKGIRAQGKVTAIVNGRTIKSECGEIQFGTDCLSGICVFNLSSIINREQNAQIIVELLPEYSKEEIADMLRERVRMTDNENVQEIFTGLFHKNIGIALLKDSSIDTAKTADKLTQRELDALAQTISCWTFDCVKSSDFSSAQATCGGINGNEIDPVTLESKKARNVYMCGEAIDVDGDCGGFNLQFAFSSGMCVGEQI